MQLIRFRRYRVKKSFVYAVRGQLSKKIKIGKTTSNMEEYIKQSLINRSGESIEILGFIECENEKDAYGKEHELHERFKLQRTHGEWFDEGSEILETIQKEFISLICSCGQRRRLGHKLCYDCWIKSL